MSDWYILNEDKTVREAITEEDKELAYKCLRDKRKIVGQDHVGNTWVSTVFLGLNHQYGDHGPPLLFETMVFRNDSGEEMWRYSTYEEALKGHKQACQTATSGLTRDELEIAKDVISSLLTPPAN